MGKKNFTITLEEDIVNKIKEKTDNLSSFIRELLEKEALSNNGQNILCEERDKLKEENIILYERKAFILARINFLNEKIDALKKENELEEEKNKEKNKEILFKFNRLCKFKGEEIEMIFSEELQKLTNQEIDFLKKEIGDAFIQKMPQDREEEQ